MTDDNYDYLANHFDVLFPMSTTHFQQDIIFPTICRQGNSWMTRIQEFPWMGNSSILRTEVYI